MSDSTGPNSAAGTPPEGTPPEGTPPEGTPPEGKETDWKAEARKWETRSKENKTALDTLTSKFGELETKFGALETAKTEADTKTEREALVAKVADAVGVPATALRGADEAELTAHAESLKELMPKPPVIDGQGNMPGGTAGDPDREAVKKLFGNN